MSEFIDFTVSLRVHEDNLNEVAAALRLLATRIDDLSLPALRALPVLDTNGNRIGTVSLVDTD